MEDTPQMMEMESEQPQEEVADMEMGAPMEENPAMEMDASDDYQRAEAETELTPEE